MQAVPDECRCHADATTALLSPATATIASPFCTGDAFGREKGCLTAGHGAARDAIAACMLMCQTLKKVVADLHRHVHPEVNIPFPRAVRIREKEKKPMQARGALMIEHRLIERMLSAMQSALAELGSSQRVDREFVDVAVDFMRTYADRTHHGKEEDILFRELSTRELSADDRRAMDELIADHAFGRQTTDDLARANEQYRSGDESALTTIHSQLRTLCDFYPRHIEKEDELFFPAARAYFSEEEDQTLLARFWAFDRTMIHEKYTLVVEALEKR